MEKSTSKFAKYFYKIIEEDMTAADVGVGSTGGDQMQGAHVYGDPNDTRLAKPMGKIQRRADVDPKKKKKKKKKVRKPEEAEQRLDDKCWDGYEKRGTKMKGGKRVNNCVKKGS